MKGILLAGGSGTRLYPATRVMSKQLVPVYDKPMIYYPLSVLMLAGIREIMVISTPEDTPRFRNLLGDGGRLGLSITYAVQERPEGIAQAFLIAESFIAGEPVCLILGDNIFYGQGLSAVLEEEASLKQGACVFGYWVKDPERYGVLEFDKDQKVRAIREKPAKAPSHYAVPGLYFFDGKVSGLTRKLKPSGRGELEITELIGLYLASGELNVRLMSRGFAWLDTGTHDAMLDASNFIATIERRQGLKIGCLEEVAYLKKFISRAEMESHIAAMPENGYRDYLKNIL
jgi:glucose-1-phosphate thymidylyltransferase